MYPVLPELNCHFCIQQPKVDETLNVYSSLFFILILTDCRRIRKGSDYRGKIAQTKSGFKCQPWKKQSPHSHSYTPEKYPNAGLDSNFCRNPDGSAQGPWCYTTSPKKIREYCAVPFCRCELIFIIYCMIIS